MGNRTAAPLTFDVWVDNVAPVLTVTDHVLSMELGKSTTVISGTVIDGSPTANVVLQIQAPDGKRSIHAAARDGERWWYDLTALMRGAYIVWVAATDAVGNITTAGPYTLEVTCIDARLTAALISAEPAASSPFSVTLTAAITNTGNTELSAGLPVAFSSGIQPIGSVLTTQADLAQPGRDSDARLAGGSPRRLRHRGVSERGRGRRAHGPVRTDSREQCGPSRFSTCRFTSLGIWFRRRVDPLNHAMSTVQRPIAGQYFVIQGFDKGARSYYPSLPPEINTLKTWTRCTATGSRPRSRPPCRPVRRSAAGGNAPPERRAPGRGPRPCRWRLAGTW